MGHGIFRGHRRDACTIAHLGLISPPIGAVYCHKKTGEPLAPPVVVVAVCLAHLVLWLTINEDAVLVTVAVLVMVAMEASVAVVAVLLSNSETTTEVQVHSLDEGTSEQARVDVGGEQVHGVELGDMAKSDQVESE